MSTFHTTYLRTLLVLLCCIAASASAATGGLQFALDLGEVDSAVGTRGVEVEVTLANGFGQGVRDVRIWIFLLDDKDRVIGERARWLGANGRAEAGSDRAPSSAEPALLLETDGNSAFVIPVETRAPPAKARILFTRILLEDGTSPNPLHNVREIERAQ